MYKEPNVWLAVYVNAPDDPQIHYVVGKYDQDWGLFYAALPKTSFRHFERGRVKLPRGSIVDEEGKIGFLAFDYCVYGRSESRARSRAMKEYGYVKLADAMEGSLIPGGDYITRIEALYNGLV